MNYDLDPKALEATFNELTHFLIAPARLTVEETKLGEGGFCEVCLATLDKSSEYPRRVAVKELRIPLGQRQRIAFRLARELKIWAKVKHPNILELIGYHLSPDYGCARLVSAFMVNGNVVQYIQQNPVSVAVRLKLVRNITTGLKYLHDSSPPICHADLKPANVLVNESTDAVLCDFGLSSFIHDEAASGLTTSKSIKGSIRYMSPELNLEEQSKHSLESDIWAWGCTAFEILTGSIPYSTRTKESAVILDIHKKLAPGSINDLDNVVVSIAVDQACRTGVALLRSIIPQCWDFDPEGRPSSSRILQCIDPPVKVEAVLGTREDSRNRHQVIPAHQKGTRQASYALAGRTDNLPRHDSDNELRSSDIHTQSRFAQVSNPPPADVLLSPKPSASIAAPPVPFRDISEENEADLPTPVPDPLADGLAALELANPQKSSPRSRSPLPHTALPRSTLIHDKPQLVVNTSAETMEQREASTNLAVDQAYNTLEEYKINRNRVVPIAKAERREGGFGVVRKAHLRASAYLPTWFPSRQNGQPQVVAVKELKVSGMHDVSGLKRAFTREVLVWSRVRGHPGIAKFLGFCADFGRKEFWLISPWEPYGNVSEFIKERELEMPEKLSLAHDTLDALEFLHQLDPPVCHGDPKAANVLVNMKHRAVLCDFGLARLYEDSGFGRLESPVATIKGSIRWPSPELLEGQPRTASSDIYAWGWLVWEITTIELPYEDVQTDYAIMRRIFEGPAGNGYGESLLKDVLQLWDLVTRCCAVDPLQRPTAEMCKTTFEYLPHYPSVPETADPLASPARLENLGDFESWKGNHKTGLIYFDLALNSYQKEGNDQGIANVLRKQAAAAHHDSDWDKRREAASAALEKCRSLRDDIGVADALFWMGFMASNNRDRIRNTQESLSIFRAKGYNVGVRKCLQRLGVLYREEGEATEQLSILEEAMDVASHCGDRLGEATALTSLGLAHTDLNHMDQGISFLQTARDIAEKIGWKHGVSTSLCGLGSAKLAQGLHAEGEGLLCESVRVARESNAGWRLSQALYFLGKCLLAQGRHEEAVSALEESWSIYQNPGGFQADLADTATLLADSKSTLGHKEEASEWYWRAIAEYRKGGKLYTGKVSECLAAQGAILAEMGRRDEEGLHGEASS